MASICRDTPPHVPSWNFDSIDARTAFVQTGDRSEFEMRNRFLLSLDDIQSVKLIIVGEAIYIGRARSRQYR